MFLITLQCYRRALYEFSVGTTPILQGQGKNGVLRHMSANFLFVLTTMFKPLISIKV